MSPPAGNLNREQELSLPLPFDAHAPESGGDFFELGSLLNELGLARFKCRFQGPNLLVLKFDGQLLLLHGFDKGHGEFGVAQPVAVLLIFRNIHATKIVAYFLRRLFHLSCKGGRTIILNPTKPPLLILYIQLRIERHRQLRRHLHFQRFTFSFAARGHGHVAAHGNHHIMAG